MKKGTLRAAAYLACLILLSVTGMISAHADQGKVAQADNITQVGGAEILYLQDLNVPVGTIRSFSADSDSESLFLVVQGNNMASIEGTLQVVGDVDVWLIAPGGAHFGDEASVDVGGALTLSTATGLIFRSPGERGQRVNLIRPPSISLSHAMQLSQLIFDNARAVSSTIKNAFGDTRFASGEGRRLALLAGDIKVQSTFASSKGGPLELLAVRQGVVRVVHQGGRMYVPGNIIERGDMRFNDSALVDSTHVDVDMPPGLLVADANTIEFHRAELAGVAWDSVDKAPPIRVSARERVLFEDGGIVAVSFGTAPARDTIIRSPIVEIISSQVSVSGFGGPSGDIMIKSDVLRVDGRDTDSIFTGLFARAFPQGEVTNTLAGTIRVVARDVELLRGGQLGTSSFSEGGDAGRIFMRADTLKIDNEPGSGGSRSGLYSTASEASLGNAGTIDVVANEFELQGFVSATAFNNRDAGRIKIRSNYMNADSAVVRANGVGGNIGLRVGDINLTNGSFLSAEASGNEDEKRGAVAIHANRLSGSGNSDITANATAGIGGNVIVRAGKIKGLRTSEELTEGNDITAFGPKGQGIVKIIRSNEN